MDYLFLMQYFEKLLHECDKRAVMVYYEKMDDCFYVQYRFFEGEGEVRLFQADEFLAFSSFYLDNVNDDNEEIHYDIISFS